MSIAADLAAITTGFGSVTVVHGDVEGRGLLDEEDAVVQDAGGGEVLQRQVVLTVRRSSFPDLAADDAVTVDGADYRVGEAMVSADGLILRALVRRVSRAARA